MEFSSEQPLVKAATADAGSSGGGGGGEMSKRKVLVAVDHSEGSLYALSWALENLFAVSGDDDKGRLGSLVLHVQQPFTQYMYPFGPDVYPTSYAIDLTRKAQEENSARLIARALQICKDKPITVETVIKEGNARDMKKATQGQLFSVCCMCSVQDY